MIYKLLMFVMVLILFTTNSYAANELVINFSANITNASLLNISQEANLTKNLTKEQPLIKNCNISIGIKLPTTIYNYKEKVSFQNTLTNSSQDFQIEYWIENLFGKIVKKKIITSNLNEKSYTPKFDGPQASFIIKNQLFVNCHNIGITKSEKLFVVKNKNYDDNVKTTEKKTTQENLTIPQITSFYTRSKKYSKTIRLYTYIKGGGLLKIWSNNKNQTLKINSSGTYQFNVTAKVGLNKYALFLFSKDKLVDFKELKISFKKTNISNSSKQNPKITNEFQTKTSSQIKQANNSLITGDVVYESKNEKLIKKIPYYLIALLALLTVILILKKKF